jgi:glycosyltransferase involved in cell wall biosynthesis
LNVIRVFKHPLVSVIIPTYDARQYVCDAIDSALAQTYRDTEIIVVDDGSSDATGELLQHKYGNRIGYLYKENGGPASARNLGIRNSRGEFIAFLDADDLWLPEKLEKQLAVFDEDTLLVGCGENSLNDGSVERIDFETFAIKNRFANSGVVIRRAALEKVGMFDERQEFIAVEDWDMWLRLSKVGDVKLLHRNLITIRVTENSISASPQAERMLRNEKTLLQKHLAGRPFLHAHALSFRYRSAAFAFKECSLKSKALYCLLLSLCLYPRNLFNKRHLALFVRIIFPKAS